MSRELAWPPVVSASISLAVVCKHTSLGLGRARGKESRGRYLSRRSRRWQRASRHEGAIPPRTAWSRVVIKENLLVKLEVTESWLWDLIAYAQSNLQVERVDQALKGATGS